MKNIDELEIEFINECKNIAIRCEEEGYPSHGSNYDLRVENLMQSPYYAELFTDDEMEY